MPEKVYTTFQIAKICNVRPTTIIKWIKEKRMSAYVTPGGHRRVGESHLLGFLKKYGFPIPENLGSRKKVLIVEDDSAVGQLLQRVLKSALGNLCQVQWVKDGVGALLLLGDHPVDLVFLDVVMPGMDGVRVLSALKAGEKTKNIKVIGMTGQRLPDSKLKFMRAHTDAFFLKPFDVKKASEKAMQLLDLSPS